MSRIPRTPPICYIAGPYRSGWGIPGRAWNIFKAWRVARRYTKRGYWTYCSHTQTAFFDGLKSDDFFLNAGKYWLRKCDVVVLMKGWQKSKGATEERAFALRLDMRVENEQ